MNTYIVVLMLAAASTTSIISKTGNHYLHPEDFPVVPVGIRMQLTQAHCLIPQDVETKGAHNIVSGELTRRGQQDWAVYCSVNGQSRLIVIWGGAAKCSDDPFGLNSPLGDDSIYETADPAQWGRMPPHGTFWVLTVVPQREVITRQRTGIAIRPLLKLASHDALQRSSIAGVTGVYCTNGRWRVMWYAD